ncbi:MAG: hypothetical protein P4L76_04085 [Beijerinckiaceae bacterium]|nr:hypothetical protein [Beijerinckiaceae bacterium]
MRRIFVLLGLSMFALGPAIASPALTAKSTILRATASPHGKVIRALPANIQIDVDKCAKAWCFVSWNEKYGYLPVSAIAALPEGQAPGAGEYPPGGVVPYYGPYPYAYPYPGYAYGGYGYGWGGGWGGGWGHRR